MPRVTHARDHPAGTGPARSTFDRIRCTRLTTRPPHTTTRSTYFVSTLEAAIPVPGGTAEALQLHHGVGPGCPQEPLRQGAWRRAALEAACSRRLRRQSLRRLVPVPAAAAASRKRSRSTRRRPRRAPACRRRRSAARGPGSAIRSLPRARVHTGASASRPSYQRGWARALPPGGGACAGAGGGSPIT